MTLSGAVLAGGRSRRMGSDKAQLVHPIDRIPLWERQWSLLRSLDLENVYVSTGSPHTAWAATPNNPTVVADRHFDHGPLGGIVACLEKCGTNALLVLAVDLVQMQSCFLEKLVKRYREGDGRGVVFAGPNGFEPLCAVYPTHLAELGISMLKNRELRLQDFAARAEALGALTSHQLAPDDHVFLENPNTPDEWDAFCNIQSNAL